MKTTLELPDELMRDVKIRAAQSGKEAEGDALRSAVAATASALVVPLDAVQALAHRLIFLLDGTVSNPNGVDDATYFDALDKARACSRQQPEKMRCRDSARQTAFFGGAYGP